MDGPPMSIPRLAIPADTLEQHDLVECTIIEGAPFAAFYVDSVLVVVECISDEDVLEKYGSRSKRAVRLVKRQPPE